MTATEAQIISARRFALFQPATLAQQRRRGLFIESQPLP